MSRTTAVRPVSAARRATGSAASARPYGTTPGASHSYVTRKPAGVEPVVATTRSTRRALPSSSTVPRNTSSGSSDARARRAMRLTSSSRSARDCASASDIDVRIAPATNWPSTRTSCSRSAVKAPAFSAPATTAPTRRSCETSGSAANEWIHCASGRSRASSRHCSPPPVVSGRTSDWRWSKTRVRIAVGSPDTEYTVPRSAPACGPSSATRRNASAMSSWTRTPSVALASSPRRALRRYSWAISARSSEPDSAWLNAKIEPISASRTALSPRDTSRAIARR